MCGLWRVARAESVQRYDYHISVMRIALPTIMNGHCPDYNNNSPQNSMDHNLLRRTKSLLRSFLSQKLIRRMMIHVTMVFMFTGDTSYDHKDVRPSKQHKETV